MERDNQTHGARTALNHSPEIREWCERFLKDKERANHPEMNDVEYAKFWKYHRPEIMHAGAAESLQAYKAAFPKANKQKSLEIEASRSFIFNTFYTSKGISAFCSRESSFRVTFSSNSGSSNILSKPRTVAYRGSSDTKTGTFTISRR